MEYIFQWSFPSWCRFWFAFTRQLLGIANRSNSKQNVVKTIWNYIVRFITKTTCLNYPISWWTRIKSWWCWKFLIMNVLYSFVTPRPSMKVRQLIQQHKLLFNADFIMILSRNWWQNCWLSGIWPEQIELLLPRIIRWRTIKIPIILIKLLLWCVHHRSIIMLAKIGSIKRKIKFIPICILHDTFHGQIVIYLF